MERDKALDMALRQIEKNFGQGSVMKMGERPSMEIETVSTGALSLDIALGIGGLMFALGSLRSKNVSALLVGSSVAVEVQRDGDVQRFYLNRGPLGARIIAVRRAPLEAP